MSRIFCFLLIEWTFFVYKLHLNPNNQNETCRQYIFQHLDNPTVLVASNHLKIRCSVE